MAITLKDVALRAGVSPSAVSRTFTKGASVSKKTRNKVEKAARELRYQPSLIARSLVTNRTKLIGLIANNFQNPVFLEVFDLYTCALQERGFRPLLVNMSTECDPRKSLRMLRQYRVDGVIIATSTLPPSFADAFIMAGVPVVHAFGRPEPGSNAHVVGIDNRLAGEMAAKTLLARGYKDIAVIGGPPSATSTKDRIAGFNAYLKTDALAPVEVKFANEYTYAAGRTAMAALLRRGGIEVVFCGDDLICMGAIDAARDAKLAIPVDIGFLGFDDMTMARWSAYDLTTIYQPVQNIIMSSVELVIAAMEDSRCMPEIRLFPCSITERSSLRPVLAN